MACHHLFSDGVVHAALQFPALMELRSTTLEHILLSAEVVVAVWGEARATTSAFITLALLSEVIGGHGQSRHHLAPDCDFNLRREEDLLNE